MDQDKMQPQRVCIRCGEVIPKPYHKQRVCAECKRRRAQEKNAIDRETRRVRAGYQREIDRKKKKIKGKTVTEIAAEAKAEGLSYGKYVQKHGL